MSRGVSGFLILLPLALTAWSPVAAAQEGWWNYHWPYRRAATVSDRLRTLREYLRLQPELTDDWKQVARGICTKHPAHAPSRN